MLRLPRLAWLAIPVCALAILAWIAVARVERVRHVTGIALEPHGVDQTSATGYADGTRQLIIPGRNDESYQWITQTQQMFDRREWRVRRIDYENAPEGRTVNATSPYRWWLGAIAWLHHAAAGLPLGAAVEQAALWADPLLHVLMVAATTAFVGWRLGWLPAALACVGLSFFFPLAADFVPGAPDDHGLALTVALWSVLLLLAGLDPRRRAATAEPPGAIVQRERWFVAAGVVGAVGLWVSVSVQAPVILGLALGGLAAAVAARRCSGAAEMGAPALVGPWRIWAISGAGATLLVYLAEFAPNHLGGWHVRAIHPLHALAWLGIGELLARATEWVQQRRRPAGIGAAFAIAGAFAAVAALAWTASTGSQGGFLAADPAAFRLTRLVGDSAAPNALRWLVQPGAEKKALLLLLTFPLVAFPGWSLLTGRDVAPERTLLCVACGPVVMAIGFACWQLSWWSTFVALACVLAAVTLSVTLARTSQWMRWVWLASVLPAATAGLLQLVAIGRDTGGSSLDESELLGLVDRDLAHWLARRVGPAGGIVLAPPSQTLALAYYGGLRGIGTLAWDNQQGLMATVRIISATTRQEAEALIGRRGITHIVLPSWDSYFREYAHVGSGQVEGSFFDELQHLSLPPWLRPVPYPFPSIAGFEDRSVTVVEVVEEQDEATALSRTAAYFLEMNQLEAAASAAQALRRFPANLGAWVARAEVEAARGDSEGLAASLKYLLPRLKTAAERTLALDRRIGLAVVLTRAKQPDLAREQVRRCLTQVDEARLRALSPGTLYRLYALAKNHDLEIEDPRLRELGLAMLPAELRTRVAR